MLDSCITNRFQYDKNLLLWLTYTAGEDGQVWYIVSDLHRNKYFLWKNNKQTKYTSDNPEDLYEHIKDKEKVNERS